jgi:hypothetical protein
LRGLAAFAFRDGAAFPAILANHHLPHPLQYLQFPSPSSVLSVSSVVKFSYPPFEQTPRNFVQPHRQAAPTPASHFTPPQTAREKINMNP